MRLDQARDLVLSYLTTFGSTNVDRVPRTLVDQVINNQLQIHFEETKSLHSYHHSLVYRNLAQYKLPDELLDIHVLKIAGQRYYPARYPYIEDAKREYGDRTRVTEDGQVVYSTDRWYWRLGDTLYVHPPPAEDTGVVQQGTCSSLGTALLAVDPSSWGEDGKWDGRLIEIVDFQTFAIVEHNSTAWLTVDREIQEGGDYVYKIYELGMQIWGTRRPSPLTIGSSEELPGTEVDAQAVVLAAAYEVAQMLPDRAGINLLGLRELKEQYKKRCMYDELNRRQGPIIYTPWPLR